MISEYRHTVRKLLKSWMMAINVFVIDDNNIDSQRINSLKMAYDVVVLADIAAVPKLQVVVSIQFTETDFIVTGVNYNIYVLHI